MPKQINGTQACGLARRKITEDTIHGGGKDKGNKSNSGVEYKGYA